jgi:hypothetical protein
MDHDLGTNLDATHLALWRGRAAWCMGAMAGAADVTP